MMSVRVQETGLAVGTVRKAVGVLVAEGLVYTVPGRGTFAAARD
jgi:DNA-binding GntR family transcriptional regulator